MTVADVTARRLQARLAHAQATGRLPSVVAGRIPANDPVWFGVKDGAAVAGHHPYDVQ